MTELLRAGVIGLGMMGRHHARVLAALPGVDLVGVCDQAGDPNRASAGAPVFVHPEQLLDVGLDLCVVATPTADHAPLALEAARRGVHTLVEKPLADTVAEGEELVRAFAAGGLVAAVGHVERCNPAVRALEAHLAEGELGDVYQVSTSRQGPFPDRVRDVGVVKDLATHDIDATAYVTGRHFANVAARVAHRAGRPHEDLVAIVGELEGGTVTSHLVNWLTPTKERRLVVTGERGCFVADTITADLTWFANASVPSEWDALSGFRGVSEGDMVRYAIPKPEPVLVQMQGFVDAVRSGAPGSGIVSLAAGLEALRVADAVLRAAAEGRVVEVER